MTNLCDDCIHAMVKLGDGHEYEGPPLTLKTVLVWCDKVGSVTPEFVVSCRYKQTETKRNMED